MMDRLIAIKDKFLAFWDKYTTKQKTLIISVVLAIFFAIVLLGYFLTRPVYTELVKLSGDTASTFDSALSSGGIDYKKESDSKGNTVFSVEQSQYSDAVLLMGENKITDTEMSWDDAFNNDMTVSSAEKQTKATLALQSSIRKGEYYISEKDAEARGGLKPCADIFYESLVNTSLDKIYSIVLTGMGSDATKGIQLLKQTKKVEVVAQDRESCVVYGMPRAAALAGIVDEMVPLTEITKTMLKRIGV